MSFSGSKSATTRLPTRSCSRPAPPIRVTTSLTHFSSSSKIWWSAGWTATGQAGLFFENPGVRRVIQSWMLDQVYARSPYLALRDLAEHDPRYRKYLPAIMRRRYRSGKARASLAARAPGKIRSG